MKFVTSCWIELEPRIPDQVRDVVAGAGDEVVHPDHLVALGQQPVAQVRAEEAGRAGDEDPHADPPADAVVLEAQRGAAAPGSYRLRPSTMSGLRQRCA